MKVLLISDRPFIGHGHKSGATVAVHRIAKALLENGYEIYNYSPNYCGKESQDGLIITYQRRKKDIFLSVDLYTLWCMVKFFCTSRINILKRIKETIKIAELGYLYKICNKGFDIVHFHYTSFMCYFLFDKLKKKPIITIHGIANGLRDIDCSDPHLLDFFRELERYEYAFFKKSIEKRYYLTFVSTGLRCHVEKLVGLQLPPQCAVVPNMIESISNNNEYCVDIRKKYSISKDNKILICSGTVSVRKNQTQLIRAFTKLDKNIKSNIHLFIVGNDTQIDLRSLIKELGEVERVHIIGFVPPQEMDSYYKQSYGVIVPSLYETFGLPIIEAFMYGLPVAFSNDLDAFEDTFDERGCVVIRDRSDEALADAICQLTTKQWDSEVIKLLGSKFTMDVVGRQYINYYQKYMKSN